MRILICDDSITIRKKLTESLKNIVNCDVFEAENGLIAVEKYKLVRPNVVFMDIVMPIMTGLEAVEEIVKFDSEANIVMLSSVGTKENLLQALEAGAVDFIQKPWNESMILTALQKFDHKE